MAQRGRATGSQTRDGQGGSGRQGGSQRRGDAGRRQDPGRAAAGSTGTGGGQPPRHRPSPGVDLAALRTRVEEIAAPVAAAVGCDLEQLTVTRAGRRHLVRVVIDKDGGVNHDLIAEIARGLGAALDRAEEDEGEIFPGEYQLEISSPGVDRPLTESRHWRRAVGRLVKVKVGTLTLTGRVMAADDSRVTLDVADVGTRQVGYDELGPGHIQVEFRRPGEATDDSEDHDTEDDDGDDLADHTDLAEDDLDEFDDEEGEE